MTVRWWRRIVTLLGTVVGGVILLAVALLTYLLSADLGRHRVRLETLLSKTLGYEVRIGELHIDLALRGPARLEASRVTLSNQAWNGEPLLLEVDRLRLAVELRPLLDLTIVVDELELSGGRVAIARDGDGRTNWSRPPPSEPTEKSGAPTIPQIVVHRAVLENLRASFEPADPTRRTVLDASRLELSTDPSDMVELHLIGALDGWPLDLAGTIGPLSDLMIAGDVRPDLVLTAGDSTLAVRGRIANLKSLDGIEATISARGPEIVDVTDRFGLPSLGGGPFDLSAAVKPAGESVGLELDAGLGDLTASAQGELDSLTRPGRIDVTVDLQGPSLAAAAALGGLQGPPDAPFRISGRIAWDDFPLTLEQIIVRVGENKLDVDGILGKPPSFSDTVLKIEGEGPDLSAIGALVDIELPRLAYHVAGRLNENAGNLLIDSVKARLGRNRLEVAGMLGELPTMAGTDLTLHAYGPGLAPFSAIAGLELPDEPFDLRGRIVPLDDRLRLEKVTVRLGATEARLSGTIATGDRFVGSQLRLQVKGDDLSSLRWAHGVDDLPAWPFRVSAKVGVDRDALALDEVEVGLGDLSLDAGGRIVTGDRLDGSELTVEISGRLPDVEPFIEPRGLPDVPFTVSGTIGVEGASYRLTEMRTALGEHHFGIDGLLVPANALAGSDVEITLSGPDFGDLGSLAAGFRELPELPHEPYSLNGRVAVDADGFDLGSLKATLGRAHATFDGRLGAWPDGYDTDLTISADGPDASLIKAATKLDLPIAPFELRGRVRRHSSGAQFDELTIRLADYLLWLDGSIGEPPQLIGSDLRFRVDGPDFALIEQLAEKENLPRQPFHLEGHARGSPRRFRVDDLDLLIGDTDVRGYLRLGLEGRKELEGRLESDLVNLLTVLPASVESGIGIIGDDVSVNIEAPAPESETLPGDAQSVESNTKAPDAAKPAPDQASTNKTPGKARRFGDEPFDLSRLDRFDADLGWRIGLLRAAVTSATDLDLNLQLADGHLRIGPFEVVGERGGRMSGGLQLEPLGESYDIALQLKIDDGWGDLTGGAATTKVQLTHVDAMIDLHSRGATPHQVAAGAEGHIIIFLEGGRVDDSLLAINVFSVLRGLFNVINPFADSNTGPAELQCAAFILDFDDGAMELEPMAVQTSNVTIIGRGGVDLDSERLNLEWVAKPRKGVGISTTTLTNPYIKLGGTLSRPAVDVKPVQAVTSTGLAIATGGLSLLGKGLWDRVTAEQKVCKKVRKEAVRRLGGEPPRK